MWVIRFQKLDCWRSDRRSQVDERRRNETDCNAMWKAMQKATKVLLALSLRKEKGQLTAGMSLFRVIDRGRSEAWLPSSRDQGHPEVRLDCACMERAPEYRESSISVDRFVKDRWLVARSVKCEGTQYRWIAGKFVNEVVTRDVQVLVVKSDQEVKFDQEVSIVEVKGSLMG